MKRSGMGHWHPGRGSPTQYFTYGPLEFNITKALALAANSGKYKPESRFPSRDWIGPFIDINEGYVEKSDLGKPVIFATVVMDGFPWQLLIDGNHRVAKALNHRTEVQVVTLDLEDTLKILRGPENILRQMKRDGQRLGLLSGGPEREGG